MRQALKILFWVSYVALWLEVWYHREQIMDLLDREAHWERSTVGQG